MTGGPGTVGAPTGGAPSGGPATGGTGTGGGATGAAKRCGAWVTGGNILGVGGRPRKGSGGYVGGEVVKAGATKVWGSCVCGAAVAVGVALVAIPVSLTPLP